MNKKINQLTELVLAKEVEAQSLENKLAQTSKTLKQLLALRDELNEDINTLKQEIRENTPDSYKHEIEVAGNTLTTTVSTATSVIVTNINEIPNEYLDEEEIGDAYVGKDGKIYRLVANTKEATNLVKLGMECPQGFETKKTKRVSIKFNGKPL